MWSLRTAEADAACLRAREIADRLGHTALDADATAILAANRIYAGDPAAAVELLEEAWHLASDAGHGIAQVNTTYFNGTYCANYSDWPRLTAWAERAMALPHMAQSPGRRRILDTMRAMALGSTGPRDEFERVHAAIGAHDPFVCCIVPAMLAMDLDALDSHYGERSAKSEVFRALSDCNLARHNLRAGRLGDAEDHGRGAYERAQRVGSRYFVTHVGLTLCGVALERGDRQWAAALLAPLPTPDEEGWGGLAGSVATARSRLALAGGDVAGAVRHGTVAVERTTLSRDGVYEVEARRALADAMHGDGDSAAAVVQLDAALARAAELGMGAAWTDPIRARRGALA
jgi:hypothetical protein